MEEAFLARNILEVLKHTYFSNQEGHSGSIWPCVLFDFLSFQTYLSDKLEKILRCSSNNVKLTDVVRKCLWNCLHVKIIIKKIIWEKDFVKTNTAFVVFNIFGWKFILSFLRCTLKKNSFQLSKQVFILRIDEGLFRVKNSYNFIRKIVSIC